MREEPPPAENKPITRGLPQSLKNINGYFYTLSVCFFPRPHRCFAYAALSDPGRDLYRGINHYAGTEYQPGPFSGNVNVGQVMIDTCRLPKRTNNASFIYYSSTASAWLDSLHPPHWRADGNNHFATLDQELPTNYPIVSYVHFSELHKDSVLKIDLRNGFRNFDSVWVILSEQSTNKPILSKTSSVQETITFSPAELSVISSSSVMLYFFASNYYYQVSNGKVFLFEQATLMGSPLSVIP